MNEEMKFDSTQFDYYFNAVNTTMNSITQEDLDDILFLLIEFDLAIPSVISNITQHKDKYNLSSYLKKISTYTEKYGKSNLLYYLFSIGAIFIYGSSTLAELKSFAKIGSHNLHIQTGHLITFSKQIDNIVKNNEDGIIYFNPSILKELENVKYRKTRSLNALQDELKAEIDNLNSKVNNFNKEIISMVSIILAIVPIIAINANFMTSSNLSIETILGVNGSLIVSISTVYFLIASTLLMPGSKKLWSFALPFILGGILLLLAA